MSHSRFSPSSSSRWINCPAAAILAENYPDSTNSAAEEGTLAHKLSERFLVYGHSIDNITLEECNSMLGEDVSDEMLDNVNQYVEYCREIAHDNYHRDVSSLNVETAVDFGRYAPGGYGTADAIILDYSGGKIHVLDFKYGRVRVDAFKNTQLMLYALGVYSCMPSGHRDMVHDFVLHVCQPRVFDGFTTYTVSVEELLAFGETIKEKSALALADNPERIAGVVQCKWCPAKGDCSALAEHSKDIVMFDCDDMTNEAVLPDVEKLTSKQRKLILDSQATIVAFMQAVSDSANPEIGVAAVEGCLLLGSRAGTGLIAH
ncbi:MAG: DUF2800 domain-containing protein [Candidatus Methanofishera endochildressiae]|uniref:DUF2800 domain-containing protein n=1 Tax=Candidatus Methanofishera endochildressiae TaxID=2738884 RepID=A0A7Z0MMA8_9GAMM|nr:DUF2800 domain-containing protein [Candidatus Methanofishera endochildressiae]